MCVGCVEAHSTIASGCGINEESTGIKEREKGIDPSIIDDTGGTHIFTFLLTMCTKFSISDVLPTPESTTNTTLICIEHHCSMQLCVYDCTCIVSLLPHNVH